MLIVLFNIIVVGDFGIVYVVLKIVEKFDFVVLMVVLVVILEVCCVIESEVNDVVGKLNDFVVVNVVVLNFLKDQDIGKIIIKVVDMVIDIVICQIFSEEVIVIVKLIDKM